MTKPCNFPGRRYSRRAGAILQLQSQKGESLQDWNNKLFGFGYNAVTLADELMTPAHLEKRRARLDKEIVHLEEIQKADFGAVGRKTKKVHNDGTVTYGRK